MPIYKTSAIVLKRRNQGESDRVLTLFSPEFGKISAIAKGARKMKSKLAGGVELFSKSNFVLSSGKTFEIVSEASLIHNYLAEDNDIRTIDFGHLAAELITKLIPEHHPAPKLYETLEFCFANINTLPTDMLELLLISRIIYLLGIYPELNVCLECREKPKTDVVFSHTSGGIFCKECSDKSSSFLIEKDTVKLWRFALTEEGTRFGQLRVSEEQVRTALTLSRNYIIRVTGNDFQTLRHPH